MTQTECTRDQLLAFLCGELDPHREQEIRAHVATCQQCSKEVETINAFWSSLNLIPQAQPSDAMRERFYEMLQNEIDEQQRHSTLKVKPRKVHGWLERLFPRPVFAQLVFGALLLVIGGYTGLQLRQPEPTQVAQPANTEIAQLHQEVMAMNRLLTISLLQQQSASERLKGVSLSYQSGTTDPEITSALLEAFKYDPNVNVRLAALDALMNTKQRSPVQDEVIRGLQEQSSPLVQIEIIDWIVREREKNSLGVLQKMVNSPGVNKAVKQRIQQGIQELAAL